MKEVKAYFLHNKDDGYAILNKKLNIATNIKSLGVRLPIIRKYAKQLSKEYSLDYLIQNIEEEYYEEILLKGFIISSYKDLAYNELIKYLNYYLPKISDWSICDSFANSLKITKKYLNNLWPYLLKLTNSKKEYEVRFAIVMILNYYICDEYKDKIYDVISNIANEEYYVKMANAWLISYMIITYFDATVSFIKNNKYDKWTVCKGITKAIESHQISENERIYLKELRKEINNS